jgi:hypothetical protein
VAVLSRQAYGELELVVLLVDVGVDGAVVQEPVAHMECEVLSDQAEEYAEKESLVIREVFNGEGDGHVEVVDEHADHHENGIGH